MTGIGEKLNRETQWGGVAGLDCLVPLQIVLPFIAPEMAGNLMATACWANARKILLISVCVSINLCMCECMNVWQLKPFALHVATFELGSVLQPLCSTNKCHFQRPTPIPIPFRPVPPVELRAAHASSNLSRTPLPWQRISFLVQKQVVKLMESVLANKSKCINYARNNKNSWNWRKDDN